NVPCIVAMSKAMQKQHLQQKDNYSYLSNLKQYLLDGLIEIPGCILNGPQKQSKIGAPHIINFSLPGLKSEELLLALESEDIYVSKSSACSSKSAKPSRVLLSAGISEVLANSAIRVSFSTYNTIEEVDTFLLTLQMIIAKLMIKYQMKQ
ncbi:MAG: cysteine desulfurase, partial [Pelosinus sp.]|nr:cysteine desulfurase [Pelosinus sp.]